MVGNILDKFQSTDEKLEVLLSEGEIDAPNQNDDNGDVIELYKRRQAREQEQRNKKFNLRNQISIHHPSYFGSPFAETVIKDFNGNSNTSGADIIIYEVPINKVALVRKIATTYYGIDFGTLKFELLMENRNSLGANGVIEESQWIENTAAVKGGEKIIVRLTEESSSQAVKVMLQVAEFSQADFSLLTKLYHLQ